MGAMSNESTQKSGDKKTCTEIKRLGVPVAVPTDNDGATAEKCDSQDDQEPSGYPDLSDDTRARRSHKSRPRKRAWKAWSEEEHRAFLEGLEERGRGDWKGIAAKFVPTRKTSQIASHAQKYFKRLNAPHKPCGSSIFDISISNIREDQVKADQAKVDEQPKASTTSTSAISKIQADQVKADEAPPSIHEALPIINTPPATPPLINEALQQLRQLTREIDELKHNIHNKNITP